MQVAPPAEALCSLFSVSHSLTGLLSPLHLSYQNISYPLRPKTQKRHQQIAWTPVRAPVAAVELDALSPARLISEDICAGCWSKFFIACRKQMHKPLINHNLSGICIIACNTAPLAVGTWISARTFYLALPASDAPATMSAVDALLNWQKSSRVGSPFWLIRLSLRLRCHWGGGRQGICSCFGTSMELQQLYRGGS